MARDERERLGLGLIGLLFRQNVEKVNLAWNVNVQVVLQSSVLVNCRIDNINPKLKMENYATSAIRTLIGYNHNNIH